MRHFILVTVGAGIGFFLLPKFKLWFLNELEYLGINQNDATLSWYIVLAMIIVFLLTILYLIENRNEV